MRAACSRWKGRGALAELAGPAAENRHTRGATCSFIDASMSSHTNSWHAVLQYSLMLTVHLKIPTHHSQEMDPTGKMKWQHRQVR